MFSILQFVTFLDKLSRAMHMEQIAKDVGVDLHTESLLLRAEQLAKLEYDKNIDKVRTLSFSKRRCCLPPRSDDIFLILFRGNSYCSVILTRRRRCRYPDTVYIAIFLTEKYLMQHFFSLYNIIIIVLLFVYFSISLTYRSHTFFYCCM